MKNVHIIKTTEIILICFVSTFAYSQKEIPPLARNDTIPQTTVYVHTGNDSNEVSVKEYKGKIILFDFWNIYCGSCIENLPHLLDLQTKFPNELKIFMVTSDNEKSVKELISNLHNQNIPEIVFEAFNKLSFIYSDKTLEKYFPYSEVPVYAWIDKANIFRDISMASSVNETNITKFINGNKVVLDSYHKSTVGIFGAKDWVGKRIGFSDHLIDYSFLTTFDEEVSRGGYCGTISDSLTGEDIGIVCYNHSIQDLYRMAFFKSQNRRAYRVYLDTSRLKQFTAPDFNKLEYPIWAKNNLFCYASLLKGRKSNFVFSKMRSDLDTYFGTKAYFEKKEIACWVVKRTKGELSIHTKGTVPYDDFILIDGNRWLVIHNKPISTLIDYVYNYYIAPTSSEPLTIINELKNTGNIDIEISWAGFGRPYSISSLNQSLKKYGLIIVQEKKEINVLSISKR